MLVFVVFEMVPEEIKFYYGSVNDDQLKVLYQWNGKLCNSGECPDNYRELEDTLKGLAEIKTPFVTGTANSLVFNTGFIL